MTYPEVGDSHSKEWVIPHRLAEVMLGQQSRDAPWEGLAAHQVVGEVTAHQADDG